MVERMKSDTGQSLAVLTDDIAAYAPPPAPLEMPRQVLEHAGRSHLGLLMMRLFGRNA